ncbi:major facilitator superfamily transporter [Nitzschia inconspicua]|uniref:Major facilitator superfamily transporter n=1 Tax=Nitzschia inconspicua TaxID=303405 RepID=A0A9K3KDW6_9STRA|nr:major facilitator superfamily transporter [Nitzschia inconspicua]
MGDPSFGIPTHLSVSDISGQQYCLTEPFLSPPDSVIDGISKTSPHHHLFPGSEQTETLSVSVDDEQAENAVQHHLLDPKRFMVLGVFSLANLLAGAAWITFAPIDDVMMTMYAITSQQVNWLSLIFMAAYGPGTAVCAWAIRKYGLRRTVVVSAFVMALGGLLRWWSAYLTHSTNHKSFAYPMLLTGQGLVSMAQPVFSNAPARVASAWFQNTAGAIGFTIFGAMLGMVLGQSMSPWMAGSVGQLLAGQALAMVVCAIGCFFYFESEPKTPPTAAEAMKRQQQQYQQEFDSGDEDQLHQSSTKSTWCEIKYLLADKQYLLLLVAFGVQYALNNALLTLLQPWIASAGFPGDDVAGTCGTMAIVGGFFGIFIAASLLDLTQNYRHAVRWSFLASFVVMVGVVYALQPNFKEWALFGVFFFMGLSQFPILPICLDAAAAHTYPISEEMSSAGLQFVGQYLGIVVTDGMEFLLKSAPHEDGISLGFEAPVNIAILALMFLSAMIGLLYNGEDRRACITDQNLLNVDGVRDQEGQEKEIFQTSREF